jgi:hypothetical protein
MKKMKNFYLLKSYQIHRLVVFVAAAIFMAGCASTPPTPAPTEQIAVSKSAISSAISAGGNEFAPVQVKAAMDKMESADKAMADKNYVLARRLAEEAQVDAKLAETTARAAKAQKSADELQESNRVLRQEIDRKTK